MSQIGKTLIIALLACISSLAVYLIFIASPSSRDLFPAGLRAWETGAYPDGLALRRHYTGNHVIDRVLTGYGGFFAAVVDGRDIATHLFCLWFLPQLSGLLVFTYWEAGKASSGFVKCPTVVSLLAQVMTAGVTLPIYFISHLLNIPTAPNASLPTNPVHKARMILPSVILGYLVPSIVLLMPPEWVTLDVIQIISAFWQPFPVYIALFHSILCRFDAFTTGSSAHLNEYYGPLLGAYLVSGVLSAVAHISVVAYSLITFNPAASFMKVFVPFWFHQYLSASHLISSETLPAYRLAARLLFQHDWFAMTAAAFVFFAWSQRTSRPTESFRLWLASLTAISVVGGPGAAVAWAAIEREKHIFEARNDYKLE